MNLVTLTDGQPTTTSLAIAEGCQNDHASVIKLVRAYQSDLEGFGLLDFKSESTAGRPTEYAILNERQATLIISYMRNSEIVRAFKIRLVSKFYEMAEQLKAQLSAAALPQLPDTDAGVALVAWMQAANLLGVPTHYGQIESVKAVNSRYGVDFAPLLIHSPAMNAIADADELLEPTELAARFGVKSGKEMNCLLRDAGLQVRDHGQWIPTADGVSLCVKHAWSSGGKSGYNLKWRVAAIRERMRPRAVQETA